jgi:FtsZ-interacting cell division protein ZipA
VIISVYICVLLRVIANIYIVFMYSAGKRTRTEGYEKRKRELEESEDEKEPPKKTKLEESEPEPTQEENPSEPSQEENSSEPSQEDDSTSELSYTARTDSYAGATPTPSEIETISRIVARLHPLPPRAEGDPEDSDSDTPLQSRSRPAESTQLGEQGPSQTEAGPSRPMGPSQTEAGPSQPRLMGPPLHPLGDSPPDLVYGGYSPPHPDLPTTPPGEHVPPEDGHG